MISAFMPASSNNNNNNNNNTFSSPQQHSTNITPAAPAYNGGDVAAVLTTAPFSNFCRSAGQASGRKPLIRGRYRGLNGGDPMLRRAAEPCEHMNPGNNSSRPSSEDVLVEAYSRSAAGKTLNPEYLRTPLALEKSMHFLVEHYLRRPHTAQVYTHPFVAWRYLWDRMRGARTTWVPQLPHGGGGGDEEGNYYDEATGTDLSFAVLRNEGRRHIRWLEFTVAALSVGAAYLCSTPQGCRQFMREKKNFLESMSQCFTDLTVWYRADQRYRNSEFLSLLLLLYGLNQESKGEDRALFCKFFGFNLSDGTLHKAPEPASSSVNLSQTYKELEKQPSLVETQAVRVAMDIINAWASRNWFDFFALCRHRRLTPLQRTVVFQSFTYARFRAIMDLVIPNYAVYAKLRVRHSIPLADLADLLLMEQSHCVQMLHAMGLGDLVDEEKGVLRLSQDNSVPLVDGEQMENCKKEELVYPTHPEYFGFTVWQEAFELFPNVSFPAVEAAAAGFDAAAKHRLMLRSFGCPVNLMEVLEPYCPPYHDEVAALRLVDTDEKWFTGIRAHRAAMLHAHHVQPDDTEVEASVRAFDEESVATRSDIFSEEEDGAHGAADSGFEPVSMEEMETGEDGEQLPTVIGEAETLVDRIAGDARYTRVMEEIKEVKRVQQQEKEKELAAQQLESKKQQQEASSKQDGGASATTLPVAPEDAQKKNTAPSPDVAPQAFLSLPEVPALSVVPLPDDARLTAVAVPPTPPVVESPQSVLVPRPRSPSEVPEDVEPLVDKAGSADAEEAKGPALPPVGFNTTFPSAPKPWGSAATTTTTTSTSAAPASMAFGSTSQPTPVSVPSFGNAAPSGKRTRTEGGTDASTASILPTTRQQSVSFAASTTPTPFSRSNAATPPVENSFSSEYEVKLSGEQGTTPATVEFSHVKRDAARPLKGMDDSTQKSQAGLFLTPVPVRTAEGGHDTTTTTAARSGDGALPRPSAATRLWRRRAFADLNSNGQPFRKATATADDTVDVVSSVSKRVRTESFVSQQFAPMIAEYLISAADALGCSATCANAILYASLNASMTHSDMGAWRRRLFAVDASLSLTSKASAIMKTQCSLLSREYSSSSSNTLQDTTAVALMQEDLLARRVCRGFSPYLVESIIPREAASGGGAQHSGHVENSMTMTTATQGAGDLDVSTAAGAQAFVARLGARSMANAQAWMASRASNSRVGAGSASVGRTTFGVHEDVHRNLGLAAAFVVVSTGSNRRYEPADGLDCLFSSAFERTVANIFAPSGNNSSHMWQAADDNELNSSLVIGLSSVVGAGSCLRRRRTSFSAHGTSDDALEERPLHTRVDVFAAEVSVLPRLLLHRDGSVSFRSTDLLAEDDVTLAVPCPHMTTVVCLDAASIVQYAAGIEALRQLGQMAASVESARGGDGLPPTDIAGVLVLLLEDKEGTRSMEELRAEAAAAFWEAFYARHSAVFAEHMAKTTPTPEMHTDTAADWRTSLRLNVNKHSNNRWQRRSLSGEPVPLPRQTASSPPQRNLPAGLRHDLHAAPAVVLVPVSSEAVVAITQAVLSGTQSLLQSYKDSMQGVRGTAENAGTRSTPVSATSGGRFQTPMAAIAQS